MGPESDDDRAAPPLGPVAFVSTALPGTRRPLVALITIALTIPIALFQRFAPSWSMSSPAVQVITGVALALLALIIVLSIVLEARDKRQRRSRVERILAVATDLTPDDAVPHLVATLCQSTIPRTGRALYRNLTQLEARLARPLPRICFFDASDKLPSIAGEPIAAINNKQRNQSLGASIRHPDAITENEPLHATYMCWPKFVPGSRPANPQSRSRRGCFWWFVGIAFVLSLLMTAIYALTMPNGLVLVCIVAGVFVIGASTLWFGYRRQGIAIATAAGQGWIVRYKHHRVASAIPIDKAAFILVGRDTASRFGWPVYAKHPVVQIIMPNMKDIAGAIGPDLQTIAAGMGFDLRAAQDALLRKLEEDDEMHQDED